MTILSVSPLVETFRSSVARPNNLRQALARFTLAVALTDALVLTFTVALSWRIRSMLNGEFDAYVPARVMVGQIVLVVVVWMAVLVVQRAYSREVFSVGYGEYALVARCSVIAGGCVGFAAYLTKNYFIPRGFLLIAIALGIPMLLLVRLAARNVLGSLRTRGYMQHRAIVVGPPASVSDLLGVLHRESWTGYGVIGVCVPEDCRDGWSHGVPVLGEIGDLADVVRREGADTVVVMGGTYHSAADLRRVGWALEGQSVDMLVAPTLTDVAGPRIRVRNVAGLPLVHVAEPSITHAHGPLKRLFDVVIASLILLVASPILIAVALAIKLHDRGPVFFRQTRVGVMGERFSMIKFRSMTPDAPMVRAELEQLNENDGVLFKIKDDPRITRIGHFIRRFSIDEMPQLINVVRGEMSLVGPRPALPSEVELYGADMQRRLLAQPGMTGLWQVSGRSDLSWEEAVRLDLYYVDNWSMVGDLVIIGKTARAVLASRGAY